MIINFSFDELKKYYTRVFIFPSKQSLKPYQMELQENIDTFLKKWKNETNPFVKGDWGIIEEHFLVILADESTHKLSGCSQDSLFRLIEKFSLAYHLNLPARELFFKNSEGVVECVSRDLFKEKRANQQIEENTLVYDTMIVDVSKMDEFVKECQNSWHHRI